MEFGNKTLVLLVVIAALLLAVYLGAWEVAFKRIYVHDHFGIFGGPVHQHEH